MSWYSTFLCLFQILKFYKKDMVWLPIIRQLFTRDQRVEFFLEIRCHGDRIKKNDNKAEINKIGSDKIKYVIVHFGLQWQPINELTKFTK